MKTHTCAVYGEHNEKWDSRGEMHVIMHLHTHMHRHRHIIIHCISSQTQKDQ